MDTAKIRGVFEHERQVLCATAETLSGERSPAEWSSAYRELAEEYSRLVGVMDKLVSISDKQSKALKRKEHQLQTLLEHAGQGFFMFDEDLAVRMEASLECYRLFGRRISGASAAELIWTNPVEREEGERLLHRLFQASTLIERSDLLRKMPDRLQINGLTVRCELQWVSSVEQADGAGSVIVVLTDVSEDDAAVRRLNAQTASDRLTGVYTRAYAEEALDHWIQFERFPISLIMVDMNGLKLTNDVFGHASGDQLLIRAVDVLKRGSRQSDLISRWGGDEFLLLLPGTDEAGCDRVMGRLIELSAATEPDPIRVSFAVGGSTLPDPKASVTEWMAAAESRMYKHKFEQNRSVKHQMIEDLVQLVELRGYVSFGHLQRVERMTRRFAQICGYEDDSVEIRQLGLLGKLHEIGKLNAESSRLSEESETLQQSQAATEIGYRLAVAIGEFEAADWILALHERWDGTGPANRFRQGPIPQPVLLFMIADLFDELTNPADGADRVDPSHALQQLEGYAGNLLHPQLTELFINRFDDIIEA